MKHLLFWSVILGLVGLVGCGTEAIPPLQIPEAAEPLVRMARLDLAGRLDLNLERINVISVEATQFSDASLGVPKPGESYAQVITPGYIIVLQAEGETYQ